MNAQRLTIVLANRVQAWRDIKGQMYPFLKEVLQGGAIWVLTISRKKRSTAQNRRYWGRGVLAQIAEQATVNGKRFSAETWHEQFKRMFIGVIELPNGQVVGMSSADLDTAEFCIFCDQVEAYAATELGVLFYDLQPHDAAQPARRAREEVAA